jgi:hypothetical protein
MPRKLKPILIETVKDHASGVKIDLLFDKNNKRFECKLGPQERAANTLEGIRAEAQKLIAEFDGAVWRPVIEVTFKKNTSANTLDPLTFAFKEIEVCNRVDGNMMQRPVEDPTGSRSPGMQRFQFSASNFRLNEAIVSWDSSYIFLEPTPENLAMLTALHADLKHTSEVIYGGFHFKGGLEALRTGLREIRGQINWSRLENIIARGSTEPE